MTNYEKVGKLQVATELYNFVKEEVLPGLEIQNEQFWTNFDSLIHELAPENKALLEKRDELQKTISEWHQNNKGEIDFAKYKEFLQEIGYLEPVPEDFKVTTANVDNEVANQAGSQLVVPIDNARYALNAANARWGSLYDALYGSDVISDEAGAEAGVQYNPIRGQEGY